MSVPKPKGPPPNHDDQRRRSNKPASYGLATPIKAGRAATQPELGFDAHFLVIDMWSALNESVEAKFFSHADWQRARAELWYADQVMSGHVKLTPVAWAAIQNGLSEMLISPADKRRIGIELAAAAADPDEEAAVVQMAAYQDKLTGS